MLIILQYRGISFTSRKRGWAFDNVKNFEVSSYFSQWFSWNLQEHLCGSPRVSTEAGETRRDTFGKEAVAIGKPSPMRSIFGNSGLDVW